MKAGPRDLVMEVLGARERVGEESFQERLRVTSAAKARAKCNYKFLPEWR